MNIWHTINLAGNKNAPYRQKLKFFFEAEDFFFPSFLGEFNQGISNQGNS